MGKSIHGIHPGGLYNRSCGAAGLVCGGLDVYSMTVLENATLIVLISNGSRLHTPM